MMHALTSSPAKRGFLTLGLAAALLVTAGCASKVKLNQNDAQNAGQNANDANAHTVAPVTANVDNMRQADAAQRLVYFDFDSYVVKPEFESLLQKNAAYLKANAGQKVTLEGHTDLRGSREYNLALGQRRADAVKQALNLLGVSDNQMESISFGKEKPVTEDMDDASQAKNRRVEIVYK